MTFGEFVNIRSIAKDRYKRELGRITVDGIDVNLGIVRDGLAWHYKQYSKEQALAGAEEEAREARRGLWIDLKPIAPWDWRKLPKEKRKSKSRGWRTHCCELLSNSTAQFWNSKCDRCNKRPKKTIDSFRRGRLTSRPLPNKVLLVYLFELTVGSFGQ